MRPETTRLEIGNPTFKFCTQHGNLYPDTPATQQYHATGDVPSALSTRSPALATFVNAGHSTALSAAGASVRCAMSAAEPPARWIAVHVWLARGASVALRLAPAAAPGQRREATPVGFAATTAGKIRRRATAKRVIAVGPPV